MKVILFIRGRGGNEEGRTRKKKKRKEKDKKGMQFFVAIET